MPVNILSAQRFLIEPSMSVTELPFGLPGRVYGSPMPLSRYDPQGKILEDYRSVGISAVVVLAEQVEILHTAHVDLLQFYAEQGMKVISLPIPDFGIPKPPNFSQVIFEAITLVNQGSNLAVHCHGGKGRTGLFLACMAKQIKGMPADQAIQWVQRFIPGAVETQEQIQFVQSYPKEGKIC